VAGFGIAAGSTWADRACERRQQAALLFNMGESKVALELMCQDDHVRDAMKLSGKPCSADIPVAQAPAVVAVPVAQAAPAQAAIAGAVPAVPEPTLIASCESTLMLALVDPTAARPHVFTSADSDPTTMVYVPPGVPAEERR